MRAAPKLALTVLCTTALLSSAGPLRGGWEQGVAAFRAGDYETAEREIRAVTAANPEWPGGHLMLGQVLLKAGETEAAVAPLERALELAPDDLEALFALAHAEFRLLRFASVAGRLAGRNLEALPPERRAALLSLQGRASLQTGDAAAAEETLRAALELAPDAPEALYALGLAALELERPAAAVGHLERAHRLSPADPAILGASVRAKKRHAASLPEGRTEAYALAAAEAERLLALEDGPEHRLLAGEVQMGAGRWQEAEVHFSRAAKAFAEDWRPRYYLGQVAARRGEWHPAEEHLRAALSLGPDPADERRVWKELGFVHEKEQRFAEAEAAYRTAGEEALVARVRESARIHRENQAEAERARRLAELQQEEKALQDKINSLDDGGY